MQCKYPTETYHFIASLKAFSLFKYHYTSTCITHALINTRKIT